MRIFPTKRGWKRLGISLATLVALALIANGFMAWRTEARLQAKFAEIRAAGDPVSIADLAPEPIPADQNAAAIVESLRPRLDEFLDDHIHYLEHTPRGKQFDSDPRHPVPTDEQIEDIRAIVDKYPDLEAGIAAAAACEQYASVADFSLSHQEFLNDVLTNRAQPFRNLARFFDWKMEVLIAAGKSREAAELGLQMLRITRLRDNEPLLVNYLVSVAVRGIICQRMDDALACGPIPPELHAKIDEELARQDSPHGLLRSLTTERGYAGTVTASVGLDRSVDDVHPLWMKVAGWPIKRLFLGALESFDQFLSTAAEPWYVVIRSAKSRGNSQQSTGQGVLADLLQPALQAALTAQARNIVMLRGARIANALGQFRDEHGREANGLEELSLPQEATIDPFAGGVLKLKHTENGWIIYSVWDNGTDEGGNFTDLEDNGLLPRKKRK